MIVGVRYYYIPVGHICNAQFCYSSAFTALFHCADRPFKAIAPIGANVPVWLAPEVILTGRFSAAADVYSLALVLWEVWTQHAGPDFGADCAVRRPSSLDARARRSAHTRAMCALCQDAEVFMRAVCFADRRPPLPTDAPPRVASLFAAMWHGDPLARATSAAANDILKHEANEMADKAALLAD